MKSSSMMSWIGIRPRIFGGFALILSFLVLLAGFAIIQVEQIGRTVDQLVVSAGGDAGMWQVRAALLEANGAVERFIRTSNVSDKSVATKAIQKVGQLADRVERADRLPVITGVARNSATFWLHARELAAIDWGAGFGRTRTATVTAREPTRLLVLGWMLVNRLMGANGAFAEQLEDVSRAHLARH